MQSSTSRAVSPATYWARALVHVFTLAATAGLAACADDPASPNPPPSTAAVPSVNAAAGVTKLLKVTTASGGTEVGSLRWAANQFNDPDNAIITFDSTLAGATIELQDQVYFTGFAAIKGPKGGITLSGRNQHRVILGTRGLNLDNLTIANGNASIGSAIYSDGKLSLRYTTIRDNQGSGSVIDVEGYYLSVYNSTISRNVGSAAVEYEDGSSVYITNSAIANNSGVGLRFEGGTSSFLKVSLENSILANNGNGQNCSSTYGFQYQGTNISSDWSCGWFNILVKDPQLMPLANNGGATMTHAIPHTSPAYNAGIDCSIVDDQRRVLRDAKCDVGPFEFNDFTQIALTIDPSVKIDANGVAMLTGTMKCTRNEALNLALELHQDQKVGKSITDVHSARNIQVDCNTTTSSWSAPMALVPGEAFQAGAARATAATFQTPEWVIPANVASAVKITNSRR